MSEKQSSLKGKSVLSAGGLMVVLVIVGLVNVIFAQVNLRWDVTQDNLFSLSDGTREILSNLKQDTVIKVFYTQDAVNTPLHIKNYARRMLDFVAEYENYGKGRVKVEVYNPEPDSEEEEWAVKYGLEGVHLPTGESIYFGLVVMAADQEEAIPTLDPAREEQLEYDITRLITRVQSPEKQKIGIITSLPVFGNPPMNMQMQQVRQMEPWLFVKELRKSYDVIEVSETAESLDQDIDLIMILHPKNLSDRLQYAIDQYVLKGGNAMAFVDPFSISDSGSRDQSNASSLKRLMDAWGVEMDTSKIILDFDYATQLRGRDNQVENNPMWLSPQSDAFNKETIATAQLESMLMPIAGAMKKSADSAYSYEVLVQSSKNSSLADAFQARFGGGESLRRDFKATVDKYDLAVKLRGTFKTAFPGGKPEPKKTEGEAPKPEQPAQEHLKEGTAAATLILVADADLLFDNFYVNHQNFLGFKISRMFNDNLNFLLNACEMLSGNEALINIRSRGKFERPFTTVQELEKKAQTRWLAREQELMEKVEETNQKLRELEKKKDPSQKFIVTAQQDEEIRKFQEEKVRINKELKEVRRKLRADIERLGNWLKFFNIFVMVFFVAAAGIGYAVYRSKKGGGSVNKVQ
jgi:ABC-type uncharacterized transport system involved in gliding motility auxiliary subunit